MRHTEVTQSPGQCGHDCEYRIGSGGCGVRNISLHHTQIAGKFLGIGDDCVEAAGYDSAEANNNNKCYCHGNALNKICGTYSKETAQSAVQHDNCRAEQHGCHIIHAEQCAEKLAAGGEAGSCIRHKEDHNDHGGDTGQDMFVVTVSSGKKVGDRDGPQSAGIAADSFGDEQPVKVCAQCKTDGGPAYVCNT